MVGDWRGILPDYVRWLHEGAVTQLADEYASGHIAAFKVNEMDRMQCPELQDISMIYLVYRLPTNRRTT